MGRLDSLENPLVSDAAGIWDELMEAIGPASLLVVIEGRMGSALRRRYAPEDVFQEAVFQAWRDRTRCEWRGVRAFRAWMLSIIDNRIRDLADRECAQKRGGGSREIVEADLGNRGEPASANSGPSCLPQGAVTTSPSKVAIYREQATAMRLALDGLASDVREVVGLRLFEQCTVGEIAAKLGIGESAVRHRFRKGADEYHRLLIASLAGSSTRDRLNRDGPESSTEPGPDSAP